jgi:hypothetical protein
MAEQSPRVPFNDRPALEELERLQRSIQEYRRKRERAEGEFEKFVGGFRPVAGQGAERHGGVLSPPVAPVIPVGAASPSAPPAEQISQMPSGAVTGSAPRPATVTPPAPPAPVVGASAAPPAVSVPPSFFSDAQRAVTFDNGAPAEPAIAGGTRSRLPILLGGAVLIVAGVLVTRTYLPPAAAPGTPSPAPASSSPVPSAPPPAVGATTAAPGSTTPAPSAVATPPPASSTTQGPAGAVTPGPGATTSPSGAVAPRTPAVAGAVSAAPPAEVRTVRKVWLRVVIDGNRALEREVEANANIPLPAGRTFVVRAGDAGAVHFFLNGRDQGALGAEAQVVTRTFTAGGGAAPAPAR